jgi:hypothetical protein
MNVSAAEKRYLARATSGRDVSTSADAGVRAACVALPDAHFPFV